MLGFGRHSKRALRRRSIPVLAGLLCLVGLFCLAGTGAAEDEAPEPKWTANKTGLEVMGVSSLKIHPKAPDILWAHVHGLGVARSADQGQNWEARHEGIEPRHVPGPRDVCEISLDPRDEKTLWLSAKGNVYKSEDQGETWQNMTTGALASYSWDRTRSAMMIRGIAPDPRKSLRVLAGTRTGGAWRGGLFESADGGKSWEQIAGNRRKDSELGHDAWPIVLDPRTDKNVAVGGSNGFWYSDDRGRKFRRADPGELGWHDIRCVTELTSKSRDLHLCDARGVWGSRDGGKKWDKKPHLVGDALVACVDPNLSKRLYAVLRDRGLLFSEDKKHVKWEELGHAEAEIHDIVPHPREKGLLYLTSPITGMYVSTDGGVTIEPVKGNVSALVPSIAAVAIHGVDPGRALAVTEHGVTFLSKDGGVSWARAGRLGMVASILRADPTETATWWAAGRKLVRTPDNGATWETVYESEDPEDRIIAMERLADGSLWLLHERSRVVVHSEDGGKEWTATKPPSRSPDAWATDFAVDPNNPKHLLLSTRSLARLWTPKDTEGGPWESWDGGKTWKLLPEGLLENDKPMRDWNRGSLAAIDPATGLLFYAADGLGLFARVAVDPKGAKPKEAPVWVEINPHDLGNLQVNTFLMRALPNDGGTQVIVQAEGENDTRSLVETVTTRVLAAIETADAKAKVWIDLPDAPGGLVGLVVDPQAPGRLLAADRDGMNGILAYGSPGVSEEGPPVGEAGPVADTGPAPPDGLLAFTGGGDAQVRVWSLVEGKVLTNIQGHTKDVLAIALSPDESVLATGGADRSVLLFNASDGSKKDQGIGPETFGATVNALQFSPDSKKLYAGMEQNWAVVELDLETGDTRPFEAHTGGVLCLDVSKDGKMVVSGSRDRTIRCWDIASATTTCKIDAGTEVLCIALSPDGKSAYAAGRGTAVTVYDVETGAELKKGDVHRSYVSDLALSPDGTRLYVAGDGGLVVVDAETLAPVEPKLEGPTKAVFSVSVSADGTWIAAGDGDNGLWLWRSDRATPYWFNTSAHAGPIHAVALTPDVAQPEEEEEE